MQGLGHDERIGLEEEIGALKAELARKETIMEELEIANRGFADLLETQSQHVVSPVELERLRAENASLLKEMAQLREQVQQLEARARENPASHSVALLVKTCKQQESKIIQLLQVGATSQCTPAGGVR